MLDDVRTPNDFHRYFPNEWVCFWVFVSLRWPTGFVCRTCGHTEYKKIKNRWLLRCTNCNDQISVKVGTVMQHSKLPLKKWLYATFLLMYNDGIPATRLKNYIDVCYETAYTLGQRIRHAMAERELLAPMEQPVVIGNAHMDDVTQLPRAMAWVAVAVEGVPEGDVCRSSGAAVERTVRQMRAPAEEMPNECGAILEQRGRSGKLRMQVIRGAAAKPDECKNLPTFRSVVGGDGGTSAAHMISGEDPSDPKIAVCTAVKRWLARVFRRMVGRHLKRYLWEYAYRYNRRCHPIGALFAGLVRDIARSTPLSYRGLIAGNP